MDEMKFEWCGWFTSSEGWRHPERNEVTWELIYVTDGTLWLEVGGEEIRADAGTVLLLEPGVMHRGSRDSHPTSFYWLHYHGGAMPFERRVFPQFDNGYLFRELMHYAVMPHSPEYLVNALLGRLLAELRYRSEEGRENLDKTAAEIYEWVRIHAAANLTVTQMAEHFQLSPDHVSRLLKKNYGIRAAALNDGFVLAAARNMLANTGKYVKQIADELGFRDDKAFIGFFKYHTGCFPTEFRKQCFMVHMNNH